LASRLGFIYKEIGIQQGLAFHESNFRGKNRQFYKQEIIALLENHDNQISLTDIFKLPNASEYLEIPIIL